MNSTGPNWLAEIVDTDESLKAFVRTADDLPEEKPAIRLGVKDIIDVAGLPTECGSPICTGAMPTRTAPCVERLIQAGATVVGKTVTTEFATTYPGPTRNPLLPSHSPGGSSSGSAAAVSSGALDWAIGTQTAGSVIRPAAFCGIIGILPSAGIVPREGVRIMSPTLDRVGFFARDMSGIEAMMAAFGDWIPLPAPERPMRIALMPEAVWGEADPATRSGIVQAVEVIRQTGDKVIELTDPEPFISALEAQKLVMGYEIPRSLAHELSEHADLLSDELRAFCDEAMHITRDAYATALETGDRFRRWAARLFQDGADAVLGPSAAALAPEGLSWTGDPFVNRIWSLSKLPAISLPTGATSNGLKSAIQLNSGLGRDEMLCAIARRYAPLIAGIRP
ncbi:amidase family protein [Amaricoccus macauensis]|uniref:amidase family protein n=1 Tax=Amaricoccus macauensis TaxID=57001 RepID=UPI003C7CD0C0